MRNYDAMLTAKVPADTLQRLDAVAARRCASRGSVIRQLITDGLRDLEAAHERWAREVQALRGATDDR